MTTLALLLFLAADSGTDAFLWPRFRVWGWRNPVYQILRFAVVRLPLITAAAWLVRIGTGNVFLVTLTVLLCLVLIWTAVMDTPYHWWLRGRISAPLDSDDHDHKGPIAPALASNLLGINAMSEAEYRTGALAAGGAVLAAALCVDVATWITPLAAAFLWGVA